MFDLSEIKWYKIDRKDYYNDGSEYIYGLEWVDKNDNPIDCEWFKTEAERDLAIHRL